MLNLLKSYKIWAVILLVLFVICVPFGLFLLAAGNSYWMGFVGLGVCSIVASLIVGNE